MTAKISFYPVLILDCKVRQGQAALSAIKSNGCHGCLYWHGIYFTEQQIRWRKQIVLQLDGKRMVSVHGGGYHFADSFRVYIGYNGDHTLGAKGNCRKYLVVISCPYTEFRAACLPDPQYFYNIRAGFLNSDYVGY